MWLQLLPELLQGYDTTTQITALFDWLRAQPAPSPAPCCWPAWPWRLAGARAGSPQAQGLWGLGPLWLRLSGLETGA